MPASPRSEIITDIELAYHTESWGTDDYVSGLREIGRLGFAGIEVPPEVFKSFGDRVLVFQEMLEDLKLRLSAVEAEMITLNEENLEEAGLTLLRYASFARASGADVVVVRPPFRTKRDVDEEEFKLFASFIAEMGKEFTNRDMRLCVRPDIDTIIEKRTEVDALMDATPKRSVMLCADSSHMLVVRIAPATYFKQYAKRLAYVRVRDGRVRKQLARSWRRREPAWRAVGKGSIKLKPLIKALEKIDYEGWVCASHPPPVDDAAKACAQAFKALEKAIDEVT